MLVIAADLGLPFVQLTCVLWMQRFGAAALGAMLEVLLQLR